jgi:hypothetical protein
MFVSRAKLEDFKTADYSLNGTREADFMEGLIQSLEGLDVVAFATLCEDFNRCVPVWSVCICGAYSACSNQTIRISPLDEWKFKVLRAVRAHIEATGADDEEDEHDFT